MTKIVVSRYFVSKKKRLLDIFLSIVALFLLWPFMLIIAVLIIIGSKGPVIFKQKRSGLNGRTFYIYKFRTMYDGAAIDQTLYRKQNISPFPTFKVKNDPRFVGIGAFLSNHGLDELPQILNILVGDMSFVGPRPLPINEAKLLPSSWRFRNLVKPGLLSSWALSDKSKMTQQFWIQLDKQDLNLSNLVYDVKLLFRAITNLFL